MTTVLEATAVVSSAKAQEPKILQTLFEQQRAAFTADPVPDYKTRIAHLQKLKRVLLDHRDEIAAAINKDFAGRSVDETFLAELMPIAHNIDYCCKNLRKWMKPSRRKVGLQLQPAKAVVYYQALGVVGVIAPWNYPMMLAVSPAVAALAAGNRVMIKMSEYTPTIAELFARLIADHFPADLMTVIQGDIEVATAFSKLPFDHLLFTGSTAVGRIVMKAAADNLTPVTLELGGKSPAIICTDTDLEEAAARICFGKSFNAGQTCVATDYVLCPSDKIEAFIESYRRAFAQMYPRLANNDDYTSIVSERFYDRLNHLVAEAEAAGANVYTIGEQGINDGSRRLPLRILTNVPDYLTVMQEEIFGPILPIVPYDTLGDALDYINDRPRPLALYLFSDDANCQQRVLEHTRSGGVCFNETLLHVAVDDMPFGGIGASGMGHYHGHEGFLTFSKARSTFSKGKFNGAKFIFPPYGGAIGQMIYKLFLR